MICLLLSLLVGQADGRLLEPEMHHLRASARREWSSFPEEARGDHLRLTFDVDDEGAPHTLEVRQQDVKRGWSVLVNETMLGRLQVDENDMVVYFPVPAEALVSGRNDLVIRSDSADRDDDIRVGAVAIHARTREQVLNEGQVRVVVQDAQEGVPVPCRVTILNEAGALQTVGASSNRTIAVRPGVVFTSNGSATFGLPAGRYQVFACRGFEWSLANTQIDVEAGSRIELELELMREVATPGWVACDTHVHSRTHSGHGDATVQERMITLAAEGIELPVATDHNVHVDHRPFAREAGIETYLTPVVGNEFTTPNGHFNIFPVDPDAAPPDHTVRDWRSIHRAVFDTAEARISILNHGRDVHAGVRPLGPSRFLAASGRFLESEVFPANAMEVINSGATQSDPLQLIRDWMVLLNHGHSITPIGSSDSHDVARHFVGQGRTYVRADDRTPGQIPVGQAVRAIERGQVLVSYGLLVDMTVNGRYGPGDLVPVAGEEVTVNLRVLGPQWCTAEDLSVFANGETVARFALQEGDREQPGVLATRLVRIPRMTHDVYLVAVATGPGIASLHWPTAKPYQPDSPVWHPRTLACTGAVWLDMDRDGRALPAVDYARRLLSAGGHDPSTVFSALAEYDRAVAMQVVDLLHQGGIDPFSPVIDEALDGAPDHVTTAVRDYRRSWRESLGVLEE